MQPMSAVEAVLLLLDLQELVVVEPSDNVKLLQELELAQLQPGPEVPVLVVCGGSTLTILPESKCKF